MTATTAGLPRWRKRPFLWFYLLLLLASTLFRLTQSDERQPSTDQQLFESPVFNRGVPDAGQVQIAYRELGPPDAPPLLMIHGTPMAGPAMMPLARKLAGRWRVIVPDLPGFGRSTARLPDYSFLSHAAYLQALIKGIGTGPVHVLAYSQGGGPALRLSQRSPEMLRSLTLVATIGVQELELLGGYGINHALYRLQWATMTLARWLLPHFGYLDDALLGEGYTRNLLDSDQRPLRSALLAVEVPTLIIHGEDDGFVPIAAAREHHRLVPQSTILVQPGGHLTAVRDPTTVATPIETFLRRVEAKEMRTRQQAETDRVTLAAQPFAWPRDYVLHGLPLVVALLLLGLGTYISEDLACITAGLLVARGIIDFFPATTACLLGIYTGDLMLFQLGKMLGAPALRRAPLRWMVSEAALARSQHWLERRGAHVIFASRFVPGTRSATCLITGAMGMSIGRFSLYFLAAALLWTPIIVGGASAVGSGVFGMMNVGSVNGGALVVALLLSWVALKLLTNLTNYRSRRLLKSRWLRLRHWEFWPMWAFYPPLVLYIAWLGLRHRGLTVCTVANPVIPAGGFIGESKAQILNAIGDQSRVPVFRRFEASTSEEFSAGAEAFMREHELSYPVVIKPDAGERGLGVRIAHRREDLESYPIDTGNPLLVQAYAPGKEYGVFYYRYPDEAQGQILAITDKHPVTVTGNGRSTLERLILDHPRALCMAPKFLARHEDRLHHVPASGEEIALVDVGTHSMGCLFLDGSHLATEPLRREIDRLSRSYPGFYFGRYDIRTQDVDAFFQGGDYQVLEINGVTSEATSIYDPANSLFHAYRVLARQWRIAFEIGAANRDAGYEPAALREIWAMYRADQARKSRMDPLEPTMEKSDTLP